MKITPKTEKELQEEKLLAPGIYDFEIESAEDKVSKSGNDMIVVTLKVYGNNRHVYVTDYLMEKMAFKLRHACDACGILKAYESGELTSDLFCGKTGKVKLKMEEAGEYPAKNIVVDYVKHDTNAKLAAEVLKDDSIPF